MLRRWTFDFKRKWLSFFFWLRAERLFHADGQYHAVCSTQICAKCKNDWKHFMFHRSLKHGKWVSQALEVVLTVKTEEKKWIANHYIRGEGNRYNSRVLKLKASYTTWGLLWVNSDHLLLNTPLGCSPLKLHHQPGEEWLKLNINIKPVLNRDLTFEVGEGSNSLPDSPNRFYSGKTNPKEIIS